MQLLVAAALTFLATTLWGCGQSSPPAPKPVRPEPPMPPQYRTTTSTRAPMTSGCLCIFDVDRTLTGKQGAGAKCPSDLVQGEVQDTAYGGGTLSLAALSQNFAKTPCSSCYVAIISAGDASGPQSKERAILHERLSVMPGKLPTEQWSTAMPVTSPLITGCPDTTKQNAVPGVLAWYKNHGVQIANSDVHFFDDRSNNVEAFKGHPYNARQISCATRDLSGTIGMCGATLAEIVLEKGVKTCADLAASGSQIV
mmetsp:Transcript_59484/g.134081  ORF Transcript_59484/g.134081 Transcript_59484/m.134081 type:complete len:254 (-) Transcript_59484:122-883(-)